MMKPHQHHSLESVIVFLMIGLAMAIWLPSAMAREIVVLPGVVGAEGVTNGVDTQGPGTLTVGAQNINTANDAGGGITSTAANTASILFNNSSTVTGFVGQVGTTFLDIDAGANGTIVTFSGPVFSTTFSVAGTGTVNFNGGFTSNTGSTMDFAGDGFINVGAGQTVIAAITNSAGAQTGTLTLNANSIVDGAVGAASGLKQITVAGGNALITGQVNSGIYTLGTNTLNVAVAFAIPTAGILNTTIFSALDYGQVVPVGAASIGATVQVNVTVTGLIAVGNNFDIVAATSGTDGSVVNVTSNTANYAFSANPTTNGLVRITVTAVPLVVVPPDVIPPDVIPVIDDLPPEEIPAAIAQLAPGTTSLNSPLEGFRATQRFANGLLAQLDCDEERNEERRIARRDNAAICQSDDRRARFWATAAGFFGDQDNAGMLEGYDFDTYGGVAALDISLGDRMHTGIALTYMSTSLDASVYDNRSDIESYLATAFLGYAPGDWFLRGSVTYGIDDYSDTRHIFFTGVDATARADYDGDQFTALGATGYHFRSDDGLTVFTPNVRLQYTELHVDGYTEAGAGDLNLIVNAQDYEFFQSGLGAKLAHDVIYADGDVLRPEVHVNWLHSFNDELMQNTATFTGGGGSFTIDGMTSGTDMYEVGGGVTLYDASAWSLEGVYDYQWQADGYAAHRALITLAVRL